MSSSTLESLIDYDAEQALVACCVIDPRSVVHRVAGLVDSQDFTDQAELAPLFDAVVSLHNLGRPVDDPPVLIADLRGMEAVPASVKSFAFLKKLTKDIGTVSSCVYYAERIRSLARLRELYGIASPLQAKVLETGATADDVIGWLEAQAAKVRHNANPDSTPISEIWESYLARLEADLKSERKRSLLSGFPAADRMGFVFVPGELTILAARPSVGKTAIATQIGMHHAKQGRRVLLASLEMGKQELGARMILSAAGKNHQLIRQGEYTQRDVDQIRVEAENLGQRPFYVYAPGRVRVGVLHAAAAVFRATKKLELLIVDYLGLVRADDPSKPRHEQVGDVCKGLRDIAQRMEIPVLALAQLNRQADGETPTLSMLRESGDIEQDADQVAFLHPNAAEYSPNQVDLIVAKNRQGARGTVPLDWHAEATRFTDPSEGSEWNGYR